MRLRDKLRTDLEVEHTHRMAALAQAHPAIDHVEAVADQLGAAGLIAVAMGIPPSREQPAKAWILITDQADAIRAAFAACGLRIVRVAPADSFFYRLTAEGCDVEFHIGAIAAHVLMATTREPLHA